MSERRFSDERPPAIAVHPVATTAAGHAVAVTVTVRNDAAAARDISVAALGVDPDWLPEPERLTALAPGETETVRLTLSPPSGTYPAQYPLAISAQATDPRTGAPTAPPVMTSVALTVNPRTHVTMRLEPAESSLVYRRRFGLLVRNGGAGVAAVRLSVQSSHGIQVRLSPVDVEVAAGETVRVRGSVRARRPRMFGWVGQHQFTVTAAGTEAVRHVEGRVLQRPFLPPFGAKLVALVTVLALWAGTAMFFLPQFGSWIRENALEAQRAAGPKSVTERIEDGGSGGSGAGAGSGQGPGSGADGSGASGGADGKNASSVSRALQLSGTVAADDPGNVRVRLEPTSLVDEEAQGGIGIGVPDEELNGTGVRLMSAFTRISALRADPPRTAATTADGTWAFAAVRSPGYYLLTFSKPGFQTRKYVVDSSSELAKEPLEVELLPGEGSLSGLIRGPDGPVGGALVTISDGTHTVTTHSNTRGRVGAWSIGGLSTPSTYVVQASKHNLSSEALLVPLAAGGSDTADLRLVAGVATLTGTVSREGKNGKLRGLGGAIVTVSDDRGELRGATTLTEGQVGFYTLPGLRAPGTYSVTIGGEGFQSQTRRIEIKRGQSRASHSVVLTSGAGTVSGTVSNEDRMGLQGAGLVLSNAEHTYKTTSVSSPLGGFTFTGVSPGTYTLTTQFFGLVTDHVTVEVRAGRPTLIDRVLDTADGGVLPARSKILGSVRDFATGEPVRDCLPTHPDTPRCLRATVTDSEPETGDGTPSTTTYSTNFEPSEQYSLPEPGATGGLRPGVHTVRITAPGYEPAEISLEVGRDTVVNAPVVQMYPVPKIQGSVTSRVDSPSSPSCVWVLSGNPDAPDLPACSDAIAAGEESSPDVSAADKCLPARSTYEGTEPDLQRMCAATGAAGDYLVEVPSSGIYTIHVVPSDPEYAAPAPIQVNAARSTTVTQDVSLNRYARVNLRVLVPGPDNTLVPSVGTTVVVNPAPVLSHGLTDVSGEVQVRGLPPGAYTFSATDPDNPQQSGSVSQAVGFNQVVDLRLPLTRPVPYLVGRVLSHVFDPDEPRPGAAVRVRVPTGYSADGSTVTTGEVNLTTQARGCFAIQSSAPPPQDTVCGALTWPAVVQQAVVSNRATEVRVTAPDYETRTETLAAFNGVRDFSLIPARVPFSGTLQLNQGSGTATSPDWGTAGITVDPTSQPAETGTIAVGATNLTDTGATLTWSDAAGGTVARPIRPGRYSLTATMSGYAPVSSTLTCQVGAGGCAFSPPLILDKLGKVTVQVVDAAGLPVNDARIIDQVSKRELTTGPSSNQVTFSDILPGSGEVDFRVQAAGHAFVTTGTAGVATTCRTPSGTTSDEVVVEPGGTTVCAVTVERLGTVSGSLVGVDTTLSSAALQNTTITAAKCTDATCAEVAPRAGHLYGVTDVAGRFSITGTNAVEGLATGHWRLTAEVPSGYQSAGPTIVELTDGAPDASGVEIKLYRKPVDVLVKVRLGPSQPVADATVKLAYLGITAPGPADQTTDAAGEASFSDVIPVQVKVTVSGPGIVTTDVDLTFPDPLPGSGRVEFVVDVSKQTGTLEGQVTDATGTPVVGLDGVTVSVHCNPAVTPGCDPDAVVTGTDGAPLTATTTTTGPGATPPSTAGWYAFSTVPPGSYVVAFRLAGYSPQVPGPVTTTVGLSSVSTVNHAMVATTRSGTLRLSTDHAAEDLGGSTLRLVPVAGTPGSPLSYNVTGTNPTWEASLTSVRWGCYRVEVTLPAGHHGAVGALAGSPSDPGLACPAGSLVVPRAASAEPLALTVAVSSGLLQIATTVTAYLGRTAPTVDYTVSGGAFDRRIPAVTDGTVEIFVPPGTYTVTPRVTGATPVFWNLDAESGVALAGGGTAGLDFALAEKTVPVTIGFSDLPPGETPLIEVDPEPGQSWYAPSPLPTFDVAAQELTVELPEGTWLIRANYSAGPAGDAITISDLSPKTVILGGTP